MVAVLVVVLFTGVQKKRGFVNSKASIGRAVCLQECPFGEAPTALLNTTWTLIFFFQLKNTSAQPYNLALQYEHPVCMTVSLL